MVSVIGTLPSSLPAQDAPTEEDKWQLLLGEARQAMAKSDMDNALRLFGDAYDVAERRYDAKAREAIRALVEVAFEYAQALEATALLDDGDSEAQFQKAEDLYNRVLDVGADQEKALAGHNLSVLLARQTNYAAAAELLEDGIIDWDKLSPGLESVCRFNAGRIFELAAQSEQLDRQTGLLKASALYQKAVEAVPLFGPATEAAYRVALALDVENRSVAATTLCRTLLESEHYELAGDFIYRYLERFPFVLRADADFSRVLIDYYAAGFVDLRRFGEQNGMATATRRPRSFEGAGRRSRGRLFDAIEYAMVGKVPAGLDTATEPGFRDWVSDMFPVQHDEELTRSFAQMLKVAGDAYRWFEHSAGPTPAWLTDRDMDTDALWRYLAAWSLDAQNLGAALYAATVMEQSGRWPSPVTSPSGLRGEMLQWFMVQLDSAASLPEVQEDNEQLTRVIQTHVVLSRIFEGIGRWGPQNDQWSARYQLERALKLHEDVDGLPQPTQLWLRLGDAYLHTNDAEGARAMYNRAQEVFEERESRYNLAITRNLINSLER